MTAEQARELLKQTISRNARDNEAKFDQVISQIRKVIESEGRTEYWYPGYLNTAVLQRLGDSGYSVSKHHERDQYLYKISWDQDWAIA